MNASFQIIHTQKNLIYEVQQLKSVLHVYLSLTICLTFGIGINIHIYVLVFKSAREPKLHHLRLSILVWTIPALAARCCVKIFSLLWKLMALSSPGGTQGCVCRYTVVFTGSYLLSWIFLATLSSPRNVWFPAGNVCLWKLQGKIAFSPLLKRMSLTLSEDEIHPLEEVQSI